MSKKYLKLIITLTFTTIFLILGFTVMSKIQHKIALENKIRDLPDFSYETVNGKTFNKNNLKKGKPVIFIYFNSECHYCQNEAYEIEEHLEELKDIHVVFVSTEDPRIIETFSKEYKLVGYDNIDFLSDKEGDFSRTFEAFTLPFMLIYNERHQLLEKRKGQTKISFILDTLKKDSDV